MRTDSEYTPSQEVIDHVDAFLKLIKVLTGNRKFEDRIPAVENKTGGATMVDVFDQVERRAEARGNQKGQVRVYINELHYTPKEISIKMG